METVRMWQRFKQEGDRKARAALIEHYLPLVGKFCAEIISGSPKNVDKRDILNSGALGLIDAIDKYDPSSEAAFETYAYLKIRGAVIDYMRRQDVLSRSVREKIKRLEKAMQDLAVEGSLCPSDEELSARTGIHESEIASLYIYANMSSAISLSHNIDDEGATVEDFVASSSEDIAEQIDRRLIMEQVLKIIEGLAEKDQQILSLYYNEGFTFKEIGQILGISESRVSQVHAKLMLFIKSRIKDAKVITGK